MMIATAKTMGRATSCAASRITCRRLRSGSCASRRTEFSIITTAPSTTIPKSMAPRLIRFAETPNTAMPMKPNSSEIGITAATIKAARTLPRNKAASAITSNPASIRLRVTVRMVPLITSDWS